MAEPCCPDRAGNRGRPFSSHWFVIHDDTGAVDTGSTWTTGGLPKSDVELATVVDGMMHEAGFPMIFGEQPRLWYMWDGSGRYAAQLVNYSKRMTKTLAGWVREAYNDVWAEVQAVIRMLPEQVRATARKRAVENWAPHKQFVTKIWNDAGQKAIRNQISESVSEDMVLFDKDIGQIVLDNGVIDYADVLAHGYVRLLPHDPDARITRRMGRGLRWEPDARCPAFVQFITDSVPDEAQRRWLLWRTCCALFGLMPKKGFINLIGTRDSGKTTFTNTIAALAGDYAVGVPVETFLAKHSGDAGFRQHELMGARFVHTHEPNPGAPYDMGLMKAVTGRDWQKTRTLYQGFIDWLPQCTPFIGSNNPIRFSTSDDAFMDRHEAVLFTRGYESADPNLSERLRAELPGILRLLMEFAFAESRMGRMPDFPASMVDLREAMASETDAELEFVDHWLELGWLVKVPKDHPVYRCCPVGKLYQSYRSWADDVGLKAVPQRTFSKTVGRRYPTGKSGQHVFTGLAPNGSW